MIELTRLRTLTLEAPAGPGRPAHVSAASGLVRAGERLYVVADDENHLGVFPAQGTRPGSLERLFEGELPLELEKRKEHKPDFESLVRLPAFEGHPDGALLALGSCSKRKRCRGVLMGLDSRGTLDGARREIDLAPLRDAFKARFGLLNIEGAVCFADELVLLQRGNKGDRRNARVRLRLGEAIESLILHGRLGIEALIDIDEIDLGAIGEVPLCFSDGSALPDGRMAFTAIAEDTADSYQDGACHGAALGILGKDGGVEFLEPIDPRHKVEGIEASRDGKVLRVLLVTDADDPDVPAALLSGEIEPM